MAHNVDDIAMPLIADRLKKAGGANYDPKQNDAAVDPTGAFAAMKGEAARKFGEIEKQGNVKGATARRGRRAPRYRRWANASARPRRAVAAMGLAAVYAQGPLSTTPLDLSVRATTVGATAFKSNLKV